MSDTLRETRFIATTSGWVCTACAHGDDPQLRIALCGYTGEHALPATWECLEWKAKGGYGSQGNGTGRANSARERVWFSPHCEKVGTGQLSLFDEET